jgi:5-methylcytosine-specific restriction endonuclease McrBC regulatory subunit McrC
MCICVYIYSYIHIRVCVFVCVCERECQRQLQVMFEGIAISRDIFEGEATEPGVAFYFVSYILISAMMLLNVVVAVLLEEFQNHVRRGKEKQQHETEQAAEKIKSKGCTHFHESSKY